MNLSSPAPRCLMSLRWWKSRRLLKYVRSTSKSFLACHQLSQELTQPNIFHRRIPRPASDGEVVYLGSSSARIAFTLGQVMRSKVEPRSCKRKNLRAFSHLWWVITLSLEQLESRRKHRKVGRSIIKIWKLGVRDRIMGTSERRWEGKQVMACTSSGL